MYFFTLSNAQLYFKNKSQIDDVPSIHYQQIETFHIIAKTPPNSCLYWQEFQSKDALSL